MDEEEYNLPNANEVQALIDLVNTYNAMPEEEAEAVAKKQLKEAMAKHRIAQDPFNKMDTLGKLIQQANYAATGNYPPPRGVS
jgi:hypothetical protein